MRCSLDRVWAQERAFDKKFDPEKLVWLDEYERARTPESAAWARQRCGD